MTTDPSPPTPPTAGESRLSFNEDWVATILGLALLALVLLGAIPAGLVP
ncbi:putative membrane protein YcfT [Micromonospora jinlongensis]|uniref:Putative membrane protein YcfT n=1 Tax=Micromonospora jinlongensis TaxID=1287877 RepID=A0A7Y9WYH6_9ACTN|nr:MULTISPECIES: hypothetical protein [Micromonospora]MCG5468202.1 hypothetical protein [Micromonospora cabrerizensis]NYH41514.1 putative membrane protein YcfT [Micromonospora jinlongensis]